jgi:hypothetical protein
MTSSTHSSSAPSGGMGWSPGGCNPMDTHRRARPCPPRAEMQETLGCQAANQAPVSLACDKAIDVHRAGTGTANQGLAPGCHRAASHPHFQYSPRPFSAVQPTGGGAVPWAGGCSCRGTREGAHGRRQAELRANSQGELSGGDGCGVAGAGPTMCFPGCCRRRSLGASSGPDYAEAGLWKRS